jgi:succinate dehydrogenase flavin-adding protein (antitoxin of CptAB toxin-antitoxin module)
MLKKLIYKSHYRGTKEGDFILSSFAAHALENCSNDDIKAYENLLEYTDAEIQGWVFSAQNAPVHLRKIILKIAGFHGLNNTLLAQ